MKKDVFRMPHLLGNTEGGVMSPPWVHFSFEEAWSLRPNFNAGMGMGGGTSPSRMNYPSSPSGDSSPLEFWNFEDQELENRKGMTMPPTWKPCREEVDAGSGSALGQNQSLGIRAAQNMGLGGTVQTTDDHSVNNVDEWFQLEAGIMMNYSLPSDDSPPLGGSFDPDIFWDYGGLHELQGLSLGVIFIGAIAEIWLSEHFVSLEIVCNLVELKSIPTCGYYGVIAESGLPGVKPCLLSLVCLCQNMVIEIGNGEQIIRLNVKLKHAYLEVVFSSEKSNAICSELETWGGMILERISVNHQRRYAFCSKTRPWSVILELLDVVVSLLLYLGTNNYSLGISVNDDRSSSVNTKMHSLLYFGRSQSTVLEIQHLNSLERQFVDHFERLVQTWVLELLSGEEIKLRYLQEEEEVGTASQKNHSVSFLPALLEAECRMMQLVGKRRRDIFKVTPSTFKQARRDFGITRRSLQEVGTASEENHTAHIWHAAAGRGGMLLQQEDSSSEPHIPEPSATNEVGTASEENHTAHIWPAQYNAAGSGGMLLQQKDSSSEPHIPESSPTNEERNNVVVVELNNTNSIDDAKGGKSSSEKTHTICRWEKDYGITLQALEQLFGKSRDDAAKTFGVSTATFKRACRYFGINRWPNHKVKRPNCSLNQKHVQAVKKHKGNQSCPALPPEEATTTTLQGNSTMSIKVTYEDNTIRFPLPSSSTLKYLEEQLETRFKICLEIFSIMYQDEEADWISLTCDSDLVYGMDVLRSSGKTVVKMKIKPNFG